MMAQVADTAEARDNMPPQKILLIRHGETDWNVEGRGQGHAPTDLNENGRQQARALAAYLADQPIAHLASSDLPRAMQTAQPLAEALGIRPEMDERWREINLGILQGTTHEEARLRHPAEVAARRADFWHYRIPSGESWRDVQNRAFAAWTCLIAHNSGQQVAVVSHGGTIKILLTKLFGEHDERLNVSLTNTSITTIAVRSETWTLESIAHTPHL